MSSEQPEIGTPVAVDLLTPDVQAAQQFYGPLLGWSFEDDPPAVRCHADRELAASLMPADRAPVTGWRTSFAGSEPAETVSRVHQAGGEVLGQGSEGATHVVHATDPAGATFAVAHGVIPPPPSLGPGKPCWYEVMTPDAAVADRFYAAVFGHASVLPPGGNPADGFALLMLGNRPVAGRLAVPPDLAAVLGARWMVYFAQPDVDGCAELAQQLGGSVLVPPRDAPTGRLAAIADPAGGILTVLRPAR